MEGFSLLNGSAAEAAGGMSGSEVRELLQRLRLGIRQPSVALECRCGNLETVYVSLSDAGELLVSDHGKSFAYLSREADATYRPLAALDMAAVEETCRRSGVSLRDDDPEGHPRIECEVMPTGSVADAVGRVAEAVDGLFQLALRDGLGWQDDESGAAADGGGTPVFPNS